jgi:hypothetical protein
MSQRFTMRYFHLILKSHKMMLSLCTKKCEPFLKHILKSFWLSKQIKYKCWNFWFVQYSIGWSCPTEKILAYAQIGIVECLYFSVEVYIQEGMPYVVNTKYDIERALHKWTCDEILLCRIDRHFSLCSLCKKVYGVNIRSMVLHYEQKTTTSHPYTLKISECTGGLWEVLYIV